jgi:hypothetical protein
MLCCDPDSRRYLPINARYNVKDSLMAPYKLSWSSDVRSVSSSYIDSLHSSQLQTTNHSTRTRNVRLFL